MTSRSIVLSTAALLLLTAAAPVQVGFSPTAASAQEIDRDVKAALEADPADLDLGQLRENIKLLRDAARAGAFRGRERQTVRRKIVAYRDAIQQHRAGRQEARQDDQQAEQSGRGERSQRQRGQGRGSERKAERRAERAERQAERRDERQAERRDER
ncbi:MAG: hypothetical protein ACOC9Q_02025, partial [bacterium]